MSGDPAKLCDFQNPERTCPTCGYVAKTLPLYRMCAPVPEDIWEPIPIGDLVEKGLTALGITKERVEKLTRTEGKPGGCGCAGRQKWLNELGNKVQTDARNALLAAKRFYVGE
jgi:hypothetical protein